VRDLPGTSSFYSEVLGMEVLAEDAVTAALAAMPDGEPLVVLHAARHPAPPPPGCPGLYHMALRLPDRRTLAAVVRRVREMDWPFQGFGDHNVSESAYLEDPEGNGIELYADRDPHVWRTVDGEIFMTTEPLDLEGLLRASRESAGLAPATVVGHVHLRVSSLEAAEEFYARRLGLGVVSRRIRGAVFLAAGTYHHHVGINVWGETATTPRTEGCHGLMAFELVVPDADARRALTGGSDEGLITDPDQIGVRICRP
jgi:catechol 2,3-dioxygenase